MEYQNDILRRDILKYRNEKLKNFKYQGLGTNTDVH